MPQSSDPSLPYVLPLVDRIGAAINETGAFDEIVQDWAEPDGLRNPGLELGSLALLLVSRLDDEEVDIVRGLFDAVEEVITEEYSADNDFFAGAYVEVCLLESVHNALGDLGEAKGPEHGRRVEATLVGLMGPKTRELWRGAHGS